VSRWTQQDLERVTKRLQCATLNPLGPVKSSAPKYKNEKVHAHGMMFDSRKEYSDWQAFELQRIAGGIRAVVRQVSLPLPGAKRRRIRIDFLLIENDGTHRWYDSKGCMTPGWAVKRDLVKDAYGIDIQLI